MNFFKPWLILTASAALFGLEAHGAIGNSSNISPTTPNFQLHSVALMVSGNGKVWALIQKF